MSKQKSRSRRRSPLILAVTCATVGLMALAPSAFAVAPVNTDEPSISGTPQQGETLTADRGEWVEDPLTVPVTYTYQWLRCDTDLRTATRSAAPPTPRTCWLPRT